MTDEFRKTGDASGADYTALEHALEVYGGDVSRWPMKVRQRHAALLAGDLGAQRLVKEARALDSLISMASPRDDVAAKAIAARAVAAVSLEHETARGRDGQVEAGPVDEAKPNNVVILNRGRVRHKLETWAAAAALVACLGLGVVMGQSGWIDPAIDVIAGLEDQAVQADGLFDEQTDLFEEDVI